MLLRNQPSLVQLSKKESYSGNCDDYDRDDTVDEEDDTLFNAGVLN